MIIVYMALFFVGFWLFGLSFTVDAWQSVIFVAGVLSVCAALALVVHGPGRAETEIKG